MFLMKFAACALQRIEYSNRRMKEENKGIGGNIELDDHFINNT